MMVITQSVAVHIIGYIYLGLLLVIMYVCERMPHTVFQYIILKVRTACNVPN